MATPRIPVEPSVLVWARESLNLERPDAASKIGVSINVLSEWESGERQPTINQLRKAASTYKRPLAVLLLPEPPTDFSVPQDFREGPGTPSPNLMQEIRRAHEQRLVLMDIAQLRSDLVPVPMELPSLQGAEGDPERAGSILRAFVDVPLEEQRDWSDPREALNSWIHAIETRGILVIQTNRVDIAETRGFSIHADRYPVIAVNGSDWPHPKIFTTFHELAHLGLGTSAICDLHDVHPERFDVEALCNRIAAAALLPEHAVLEAVDSRRLPGSAGWSLESLGDVSSEFKVSREATLLRLVTLGRASWHDYSQLKPQMQRRYRRAFEAQRERMREAGGGPSYYTLVARNLGRVYTSTVLEAYRSDIISSLDVATYLGIRFKQLERFESVA